MAKKDLELRPVMTRIPEGLRRRLERQAKWLRHSMNAEIVSRLEASFNEPDLAQEIASDVESAIDIKFSDVYDGLSEIQSQISTILAHLGLPDPVEEAKARRKAEALRRAEARKARASKQELESAVQTIERTFGPGSVARMPSETEGPPSASASETKDGEKK
jgi:hypothetical protein